MGLRLAYLTPRPRERNRTDLKSMLTPTTWVAYVSSVNTVLPRQHQTKESTPVPHPFHRYLAVAIFGAVLLTAPRHAYAQG